MLILVELDKLTQKSEVCPEPCSFNSAEKIRHQLQLFYFIQKTDSS